MSDLAKRKSEGCFHLPNVYLDDYVYFIEIYVKCNKEIMAQIASFSPETEDRLKLHWQVHYEHRLSNAKRSAEHLLHEYNFDLFVIFASNASNDSRKAVEWCNYVDEVLKELMSAEYFDRLQNEIEGATPDEWEARDWRDQLFTRVNEMHRIADFTESSAGVFQRALMRLAVEKNLEVESKSNHIRDLNQENRKLRKKAKI